MSRRTSRVTSDDYLHWLGAQIRDEHGNPGRDYWDMCNVMFNTPFVSIVPMDENRMADGMDLRVDFARQERIRPSLMPKLGPCSFLEVLIGLSRRMEFMGGGNAPGWAWQLLCNLELDKMYDPLTQGKFRKVHSIMSAAMYRTYDPDGTGGFFPLTHPDEDQTRIELWYQMNAYISELHASEN